MSFYSKGKVGGWVHAEALPGLLRFTLHGVSLAALCAASSFACSSDSKSNNETGGAAGSSSAAGGSTSKGGGGASSATGGSTSKGGGASSGGAINPSGGSGTPSGGKTGAGGAPANGGAPPQGGRDASVSARDLATALGRQPNFLIGLGNDLDNDHSKDGAYTLGVTLDLHYAYLVGLPGKGGWPDWNADGTFVNILTDSAKSHGVTPMFTLYSMAANGENNMSALTDDSYMKAYWDGAKLMYQRIAAFGEPAAVQFEPDFWGYVQQNSHSDPASLPVHVSALAPDCASLPNNVIGLGKCLIALAHKYAPKARVGFHASGWADSDVAKISKFLLDVGAADTDFLTTDTLDRDAGCFEAHTDPNCQRDSTGVYWDETNQTSPNFHEHLAWVKKLTSAVGKPMLWWQTPLGVPSTTPGGTAGHYRDNRVKYVFSHIDEFIDAGGVGVVFGTGAGNQTDINTDGNQFKNAVTNYYKAPVALP